MGSVRQPPRRLPARVYWVRRGLVTALALLLVLGIGKLIGTGSDTPAAVDRATPAAGRQVTGSAAPAGPVAPARKLVRQRGQSAVTLPEPDGPCLDDEVTVLPSVPDAAAGGDIIIKLQLLGTRPACAFEVSEETLAVKVTSGTDRIWSTEDCARAITPSTVTVYSGTPTEVSVRWHGRRSDDECSTGTSWAMPGFYHVLAAAKGSTPTDVQFEVSLPDKPVVTRTVRPKPAKSASTSASGQPSPSAKGATGEAKPSPSRKP